MALDNLPKRMKEGVISQIKNSQQSNYVRGITLNQTIAELVKDINTELATISPSTGTLKADTISEVTADTGVTIDGVEIKDGGVRINRDINKVQSGAITTGVELNLPAGVITTVSSTLAAGSNASFIVSNSYVQADSIILLTVNDSATAGIAKLNVQSVGEGAFTVNVTNIHGTNAFNNVLKINFLVV